MQWVRRAGNKDPQELYNNMATRIPLGRVGEAEEYAGGGGPAGLHPIEIGMHWRLARQKNTQGVEGQQASTP